MKNILNKKVFVAALALGTLSLTGCIEETLPLGGSATDGQLAASSKATEALLAAPTAFINQLGVYGDDDYDFGYGALMHIRDVMTADMTVPTCGGYNWFYAWSTNLAQGERYALMAFPYYYYNKAIQTANNILKAIDFEKASDEQKGLYAVGCAWRALFYLDYARMYEFLPNDKTSNITAEGHDITKLTVPIVTEKTTEDEARNNPRATREKMLEFIESDLNRAEENIQYLDKSLVSGTAPTTLAAIYGLKARLYLWVENYEKAAEYARKAIDLGTNEVMTKDECLSTTEGFNAPVSSWIIYSQQTDEDATVLSKYPNWTSFLSNEQTFGYTSVGPYVMITSDLYNKISASDFRKLWFKAPSTSPLAGTEPVIDQELFDKLPTYASLKFRPGKGETDDYKIAAATAYPIMRIEEMYFIEAEAVAHDNAGQGKALLEDFMKGAGRNESYTCKASSSDDVVREIITQKSIEFFGEGISFFDIKRLNYSVDRTLSSNVEASENFKTEGRPAWMNFSLLYSERTNNKAVDGYQNPDPSGLYKAVATGK